MDTTSVIWIVVIVVALVVVGLVFWNGRRQRDAYRRAQAEELREQLRHEDTEVRQRESVAAEGRARARAAKAEADAKAVEAERLINAADTDHSAAAAAREQLEQRRQQVDSLDPSAPQRDADTSRDGRR